MIQHMQSRQHATLFGYAIFTLLVVMLEFAAPPARADSQAQQLPDLPGISSTRDFASGLTPLTLADVQFYIKIMQATVARYQHPTAQDRTDLAAVAQISKIKQANNKIVMADMTKAVGYMQAGNRQKGMEYYTKASTDAFHPTPAQHAALHYYRTVLQNIELLTVDDAHMPRRQWFPLASGVAFAAGANSSCDDCGSGGGDEPKLTPAQLAHARILERVNTANQKLIAPYAAQIRKLHSQVHKLTPAWIERG